MKLSELKSTLENINDVNFVLPSGQLVPNHFHLTEIGKITKHFIDCGGTERTEEKISFQLWTADDYDHRLSVEKLGKIISLAETKLGIGNSEIEIEYQGSTIEKYGLGFNGFNFELVSLNTDCLAKDNCGIPEQKQKVELSQLSSSEESCCTPGGGCC